MDGRIYQSYHGYSMIIHVSIITSGERENDPFQIVSQLQVYSGSRIHQTPQVR